MHTCISSHGLKRSWRSCPRRVNAGNKNTPSTHHPRIRDVTTLMVGLKKRSHTQKSHPKVVIPRDIAGERKEKKKRYWYSSGCSASVWHYGASAGAGWSGVNILCLRGIESVICSFYVSVAVCTIVWADLTLRYVGILLGIEQQTNNNISSEEKSNSLLLVCFIV